MLNKLRISSIVMVLVGSLMFTGCQENIEVRITNYEDQINKIASTCLLVDEEELDEQDAEMIKTEIDKIRDIKAELNNELEKLNKEDKEYKLFEEMIDILESVENCYDLYNKTIEKGGYDKLSNKEEFSLAALLGVYEAELEQQQEEYEKYKQSIGMSEVLKSTKPEEPKEEVKEEKQVKEEPKEEVKEEKQVKEEPKQEENKYQGNCVRCGKDAMLDNIMGTCEDCKGYGQCYDCGEYKLINKMTYNGRTYHCGCADKITYVECNDCGLQLKENEVEYLNGCALCHDCKSIRCEVCGSNENTSVQDGRVLCPYCYDDMFGNNDEWTCENCGRVNVGEVMCECEVEALQ